jgi:hypothetical protein
LEEEEEVCVMQNFLEMDMQEGMVVEVEQPLAQDSATIQQMPNFPEKVVQDCRDMQVPMQEVMVLM